MFIGIRNDITSVQAVKRLLRLKAQIYAVDTGSRDTIFHPKLYLASDDDIAYLIVGSANLTFQGLHNNIEASAIAALDLNNANDKVFVESTIAVSDELLRDHPRHVFLIKDEHHAEELFQSGRLADETVIPAPAPVSGRRPKAASASSSITGSLPRAKSGSSPRTPNGGGWSQRLAA